MTRTSRCRHAKRSNRSVNVCSAFLPHANSNAPLIMISAVAIARSVSCASRAVDSVIRRWRSSDRRSYSAKRRCPSTSRKNERDRQATSSPAHHRRQCYVDSVWRTAEILSVFLSPNCRAKPSGGQCEISRSGTAKRKPVADRAGNTLQHGAVKQPSSDQDTALHKKHTAAIAIKALSHVR
jgi:hypothetical protein